MTGRLKIAIVGPAHPFRGGIAHHTTLLHRHLRERHSVRHFAFRRQYPLWIYPAATDRDPSAAPLVEPGVEHVLDSMNPLTWLRVAHRVRHFAADALIIPWWVAFWAPQMATISRLSRRGGRTRIVYLCHNVVEHESSGLRRFATRLALGSGDSFIVHSSEDRDNLERLLPGRTIVRAELPSLGEIAGNRCSREEARARLNLDPATPTLLFFGFVRPYKGLKHVLQAMPNILAKRKVRLVVAGEFWHDRAEYLELISRLGIEHAVTIVDRYVPNEEVRDLFAAADLVVQPYESATQSGVTQIAFDARRPVVVTSVGGLPETVRHGVTGYVVPPFDHQSIADAVADFLDRGRAQAMESAIEADLVRFCWPSYIDAIERAITA